MAQVLHVVHLKQTGFPMSTKKESFRINKRNFCFIFCRGKENRKDVYQAPYVWVQFNQPKLDVLINVICRIYGENIDFDKKTARALTRFQIYVKSALKSEKRLIRSEV